MRPDRSDHRDGIDLRRGQELGAVPCQLDVGTSLSCALEIGRIAVADGYELAIFETLEIPDHVRTPIAVTDDPNT